MSDHPISERSSRPLARHKPRLGRRGYCALALSLMVGLAALLYILHRHHVQLLPDRVERALAAFRPAPLQITIGPADQVLPPLLSPARSGSGLAPDPGQTIIAPNPDRQCLEQANGVFDDHYLACVKRRQHPP